MSSSCIVLESYSRSFIWSLPSDDSLSRDEIAIMVARSLSLVINSPSTWYYPCYKDFQAPSYCVLPRDIKISKHPHIVHCPPLYVYPCMFLCISTGQFIKIQDNQSDRVAEAAEGRRSARVQWPVGITLKISYIRERFDSELPATLKNSYSSQQWDCRFSREISYFSREF